MTDPFQKIVKKVPGSTCINNYECTTNACLKSPADPEGKTYCAGH